MFRSIVASAAVVALAASASAQTPQQHAGALNKVTTPTQIQYTMGSGFQIVDQTPRSGPETLFNTRDATIYYYTGLTQTDMYLDEGSFAAAGVNGTEQVNGITFDYCTDAQTANEVASDLSFYAETIAGVGITGYIDTVNDNAACAYLITGLPGAWDFYTNTAIPFGCWSVGINLAGGFECTLPQEATPGAMNTFGMGNTMYNSGLAFSSTTGPFLDSLYGFDAMNHYGAADLFEWYNDLLGPGYEWAGTYWFGGPPKAQANFTTELFGNPTDTVATYSATPGAADTVDLQADVEVRGGQAAGWTITNPTVGANYALLASMGSADLPILGGNASLLVNWLGAPLLPAPIVMAGGTHAQNLPPVLPPTIHVQAVEYVGPLSPANLTAASNRLTHTN